MISLEDFLNRYLNKLILGLSFLLFIVSVLIVSIILLTKGS